MNDDATVGDQLRLLRTAVGMTQTDLATTLGLEQNSEISKIETGRTAADPDLLERIAAILDVHVNYFSRTDGTLIPTRPWLRAYHDAHARNLDTHTADNQLAADAIHRLKLRRIPTTVPTFQGELDDEDAIEDFAQWVRDAAGIADGAVVGNTVRAAERLGVLVLPMDDELGRHVGLSQRVGDIPVIKVARPRNDELSVPGDRQRFTVAHELGHLALHGDHRPPSTPAEARLIEGQAHRFAAAFLAPADAINEDLDELGGRPTLATLAELKARWGVAIKMLVLRMRHLGRIDEDQARSLYKQISARGWSKQEPVPVTNESAVWLSKALAEKAGQGPAPVDAGLGASHYARWTTWTPRPAAPDATVHALTDKRLRSADVPGDTDAEIRAFRRR